MITRVFLYTDGACKGNPDPVGYVAILRCNGRVKELTGSASCTTNNRMVLPVVIAGLQASKHCCPVTVQTVRGHSGHTSAVSVQAKLNERADALAQKKAWRWMQGGGLCAGS